MQTHIHKMVWENVYTRHRGSREEMEIKLTGKKKTVETRNWPGVKGMRGRKEGLAYA